MSDIVIIDKVSKHFPGVKALDQVSLTLTGGSVHALMGENGAGKSTLMKCLFGIYKRDEGRILLDGKEVSFDGSRDALENGIAMVHQELSQALDLTVKDNLWLGRYPRLFPLLPFIDDKKAFSETERLFSRLKISADPNKRVGELPVSQRQMIEIAKAVSYNAKVIVFDEPTSSLDDKEVEKLFSIIRQLREEGRAIVYISHKMAEIRQICDKLTVMRDGRVIKTMGIEDADTDEIIRLMVGRKLEERYPTTEEVAGKDLLKVEGLTTVDGRLQDAELTLKEGEILGVAGLEGSGRTELLEAIFGLRSTVKGKILLRGKTIQNKNPKGAIKNGFALLTEERRKNGIFGVLSITDNTVISSLRKYSRLGVVNNKLTASATDEKIKNLKVKTTSRNARIENLSGGNQQKVIIGRWLLSEPTVLMLDEPTRGIDVGAKYEIYKIIASLKKEGRGVIMVSSEMGELLGMSDRILVMSSGKVAGVLDKKEATQEKILALSTKYT